MAYGAYSIIIVDEAGKALSDPIERMANTGHPDLGHKVWLDGVGYEVIDVHHDEDPDARASVPYSIARVCVRRLPGPATPPHGPRGETSKTKPAPAKVLSFPVASAPGRPPSGGAEILRADATAPTLVGAPGPVVLARRPADTPAANSATHAGDTRAAAPKPAGDSAKRVWVVEGDRGQATTLRLLAPSAKAPTPSRRAKTRVLNRPSRFRRRHLWLTAAAVVTCGLIVLYFLPRRKPVMQVGAVQPAISAAPQPSQATSVSDSAAGLSSEGQTTAAHRIQRESSLPPERRGSTPTKMLRRNTLRGKASRSPAAAGAPPLDTDPNALAPPAAE